MENLITVNELRDRMENGTSTLIIDVRVPEAYANGHIPGAINIPVGKLSSALFDIPGDRPVVIYCNMHNPGGSGSEDAVETLLDAGYYARALRGGFPEWKQAGCPIERYSK
jgi:rhodanese-related sulfurtransferase